MVKLILKIDSSEKSCKTRHNDEEVSKKVNAELQNLVTLYKDKINYYYHSKLWDKFKKLSNEYESIFSSSHTTNNVSVYTPVSRSFFKLWEILHDFEDDILHTVKMKTLFLAEGPGGFMEAFMYKRLNEGYQDDVYGITLKSNNNKNIPDWKYTNENVKICYGKDGTGNLYNIDNILHLAETIGFNMVDFITADGGFDFSSNFNNQEELSFQLIVSEVLCALLLQKEGGTFIIKVYDCFNLPTIRLLTILFETYQNIHFIKPLTSRPANSERYILCTGFKDGEVSTTYKNELIRTITNYTSIPYSDLLKDVRINSCLSEGVLKYNAYYTTRQVYYIQRTINYINKFKCINTLADNAEMNAIMEHHSKKSKKWCERYRIPFKTL